jgi:NAD(P)-dependent dehydrogenase (short-subunit alcohol dehydrogenase family)
MKEGTKLGLVTSLMGSVTDNTSGGYYGYRMSKSALNIAGKSLSVDLKNKGVVVTLLHPGYVKTQMTDYMGNVPPETSALGMIRVLEQSTLSSSGSFYHYQGKTLPW